MKTSRLLYLCAHQMTAYRWQSGELASEGDFSPDEAGWQQFADYLRGNAQRVFALVANVAEEAFHVDTLPFLRGADRRALIERKLGQLYFNNALTATLSLGYEKNRRKDERVLLAALTNRDLLAPWLTAISAQHVALSGVYSLPLLAPALLQRLAIDDEPCLLLSIQDQSIRQSYFEKGELHFSRLAPLTNSSISGIAQAFASEAQKLQQYLVSQRLLGRQQQISAFLLAHASARPAIEHSCVDSATIRYEPIDINACAQRIGLRTTLADSHCEPLFLHLLAGGTARTQFAGDTLRHDYHLGRIRSALYGVGAATLLCGLTAAGVMSLRANGVGQQTQQLNEEAATDRQRYQQMVATFPAIATDTDTLRRVVDRYAALAPLESGPEALYREISRALNDARNVRVERIDWQLGDTADEASDGGSLPAKRAVAAGDTAANERDVAIVRATLEMDGSAGVRQVLVAFDAFVNALKANGALQVDIVQRPYDVESGKSLKGGQRDAGGVESVAPRSFAVRIARRSGS